MGLKKLVGREDLNFQASGPGPDFIAAIRQFSPPTYVPAPASCTLCGLPPPLSLIPRVALREPSFRGENVIVIVQLAPAATLLSQVFVWLKSPGSAPVNMTPEIDRTAWLIFVKVKMVGALVFPTATLPKLTACADRLTTVPVPASGTVCGESTALSAIVKEPILRPRDAGLKVTAIVQLPPTSTVLPQALEPVKSPDVESV
jgi:hypothetical protein